jgi:hypothetical protein
MKSKRERNADKLIDIDAVTRDDALLDLLGRGDEPVASTDDPVVRMLYLWRRDLAADEKANAPWWAAMSRRLVTAAAAAVIGVGSLGGVAAAAGSAEPGSPLWGVTEVVYAERADSLTAKENALDALSEARGVIGTDPARARELLAEAIKQAARVRGQDGAEAVRRQIEELRRALGDVGPGNSSSPGSGPGLARPVPGNPTRPDGAQQTSPPVTPPAPTNPPTTPPSDPPTNPASDPPTTPPTDPTPTPTDPTPSESTSASSDPTGDSSPQAGE